MNYSALQHGGNLEAAVKIYGIPRSSWLDISTGISPYVWPVPPIPKEIWQRLPEADGEMERAALLYYGSPALPIPGSQWAIQQLPPMFTPRRVWIARESYEEYRHWWQQSGHQVCYYDTLPDSESLRQSDVVIVINPNNPTATLYSPKTLLCLAQALESHHGWLIVDEAFMDATPILSLTPHLQPNHPILVLRSIGKFFGLAGIRLGFVLGNINIRQQLLERLGPWAISHPTAWIGTQALRDCLWHQHQRLRLIKDAERLHNLLARYIPAERFDITSLFVSAMLPLDQCQYWFESLARQAVWIRRFPNWQRLRFGLPILNRWEQLEAALSTPG